MKLNFSKPKSRRGTLLIECLVYIAVFMLLTGIGFASFYLLWDNSTALRYTTDDVGNALRAGEAWRADVRGATGKIQIEHTPDAVVMKIPHGKTEIDYRSSSNLIWKKTAGSDWRPILSRIKTSQMELETRNQISAWHWDLELTPHQARSRIRLPLVFSFEAVAPHQP